MELQGWITKTLAAASPWEPDEVMPVLFVVFLTLFMVIGIYPSVKKALASFRQLLQRHRAVHRILTPEPTAMPDSPWSWKYDSPQLNDLEVLALRHIAQARWAGLTPEALAGLLHLKPGDVVRLLKALCDKGLAWGLETTLFGTVYGLTRQGRAYAVQQGFLPQPKSRYLWGGP